MENFIKKANEIMSEADVEICEFNSNDNSFTLKTTRDFLGEDAKLKKGTVIAKVVDSSAGLLLKFFDVDWYYIPSYIAEVTISLTVLQDIYDDYIS